MKILVIQKKFMGDVLVASSLFTKIRQAYPNSQLHYLIDEKHQDILRYNPYIDKLVFFEDSFFKTLRKIRSEKYDVIIDVYSKLGTALLSKMSGAGKSIGYHKSYLSPFYTYPIKRIKEPQSTETALALEHRQQCLEPIGITYSKTFPVIFVTDEERTSAKNLLTDLSVDFDKAIAMISTFGSTSEKTYTHMKEVLEEVGRNPNVQILCNYLPSQKQEFQTLLQSLDDDTRSKIITDFDTKNLREFIAVTSFCTFLVGNEGGATNISKSLGIPTFGIFAPYVDKKTWAWAEDGIKNTSVHVHDFNKTSQNYEDLKPELFLSKLRHWISQNLV